MPKQQGSKGGKSGYRREKLEQERLQMTYMEDSADMGESLLYSSGETRIRDDVYNE